MNAQEALARIKEHRDIHFHNELNAIYITEALDMAIEALEKQIPEKVKIENGYFECPYCQTDIEIDKGKSYCEVCGQALDWSDIK